ncbi:MAG: phage tail protein [Verrucomicrobiota bacterium]
MGSGGKGAGAAGKVYDYYASFAAVLCAGPLDGLAGIVADGKLVWPKADAWKAGTYALNALATQDGMVWRSTAGSNTTTPGAAGASWARYVLRRDQSVNPQSITVEGYGIVFLYWGTDTQTLDASGEALLTAGGHPAYKRQAVAVMKKFLCGRERTSLPNLQFIGFRYPRQSVIFTASVPSGSLVVGQWYEVRGSGTVTHAAATVPAGGLFLASATTWAVGSGSPTVYEVGLDADWQANPFAVLAEYLTNEQFGLGLSPSMLQASSWATAAAAARSNASSLFLSPLVTKAEDGRAFVQRILDHVDGWLRWNSDGQIEAGLWSHGIAPPTWTSANTIDYHDLTDPAELNPTSWQETTNVSVVNYSDRTRSYKTRPARAVNSWNREGTGGPRIRSLDRPYFLRAAQAAAVAAEDAKISGQPFHEGTLEVRAEKAATIRPGDLFRLTHDAIGISVPCRCTGKAFAAPPSGRVTLAYQTDRGLSAIPYSATTFNGIEDAPPPPSKLADFQLIQIPPSLGDGADFNLALLAARGDALTSRVDVWLRKADSTDFLALASVPNFAIAGTVSATFAPFVDGSGFPVVDKDTVPVRVAIASGTPAPELDRVDDVQTEDAIEEDAFLLFLVRASDPTQFEVLTVKGATLVSGRTFDLVVRRARFGTQQGGDGVYSWASGDRAWLISRALLAPFRAQQFETLATAGDSATFRLVPATAYQAADLADVYDAGTNPAGRTLETTFDFLDPYAPAVTWTAIQQRPNATTAWADVTVFSTDFDPSTEFRVVGALTDATGDLSSADFQAVAGNLTQTLFAGAVSGAYREIEAVFKLPAGDWGLVMKAEDLTGRRTESPLTPIGGGASVILQVRPAGYNVVANPVIASITPTPSNTVKVRLSSSTAGSTLHYQVTAEGAAPGATWTTWTADVVVGRPCRVHAYASKGGMIDSAIVRKDFPFSAK